jgi:hypothetical protein
MKYNNFIINLLQGIFTIVGLILITIGYFSEPGSTTDDGSPLDTFLYLLGSFFILLPLVLFGIIRYFLRRAAAKRAWLVENGIKGKARVLKMHNTHFYINGVPQMALDLQITTSLGERYKTSHKTVVPMQYYNIIRPDRDLPVYIDPNNKNKLFIDFQQAWMDLAKKNPTTQ